MGCADGYTLKINIDGKEPKVVTLETMKEFYDLITDLENDYIQNGNCMDPYYIFIGKGSTYDENTNFVAFVTNHCEVW